MSIHIPIAELQAAKATPIAAPVIAPRYAGPARSFDLPPRLHVATVGTYLVYLAVMAAAFGGGENSIPLVICAIIVAACFLTPALWAKMQGPLAAPAADWDDFAELGIQTATGRLKARDAIAQVMILPVLILIWGLCTAIYGSMLT